ncbi:hypothetical protein SKAU_G00098320 [Synaphobranchus kaupii]|uniref:Deoxycytidylate deaminase n=1 Tax=Synaphobranchus kaupii TaxID=118154 RepID=A0A9Q1FXQ9_SYNKA|nr:hypothetical protein SKAU_G00098320 [Synaphobranchus kaupii]
MAQQERVVLNRSKYFMATALLSAQRSEDPNTQVGACIVNQEENIVGIGYNRMPNGCDGKLPWERESEEWLDNKYPYVCHAELNAIVNKTSADVKGCAIYVTLFPCNECAKLIIQAGIKDVIYLSDKYHGDKKTIASKKMLNTANINVKQFQSGEEDITITFTVGEMADTNAP